MMLYNFICIMNYEEFIEKFDKKLIKYFDFHKEYIFCKEGCSFCCENGDYPLSQLELKYLMKGFTILDDATKKNVQDNIKNIKKGGKCPFLINSRCSIYQYRPIVCRVHGLAYLFKDNKVKLPYCANKGKNYSAQYDKEGEILINPILENLDTPAVLKNFDYGEIRNLFDWLLPHA